MAYERQIRNSKNNVRTTWNLINREVRKKVMKENIQTLNIEGKNDTNQNNIVELFYKYFEDEVEVILRTTVSRSVCLGVRCPSVIYCTIASRPCQSSHSWVEVPQNSRPYFTVSSETPQTWKARSLYLYPPGTGWPSYTPGHWVPFCRLLRLAGTAVEVF
jgi:hypothetical protein